MFTVFLHNESVDRSSFSSVGSLFHARGAATEKALSPICQDDVCGMMRLQHDEARSVDHAGILATGVSKSEMYSDVCPRSDLWISKHSLYWILSATGDQCNSLDSRSHTVARLEILNSTCRSVQDSLKPRQCGSWNH